MSNLKLVRDNLEPYPGVRVEFCADQLALRIMLCSKLIEEAREAAEAATKKEFIEEIADLAEVVETLMSLNHVSQKELKDIKDSKRQVKGGFTRGKLFRTEERTN
jgi:predicted house-cleaning noncanonical NTP pyrophosphatase (MazG superfamily)